MAKNSQSTKSKKNSQSKKNVIALVATLVLLIGGSFAWLTLTLNGTKTNVIKAGTLSLTLDDTTTEGISITEAIPVSDTAGLATTAYTFTLKNDGTIPSDFTIYLDDVALEDGETRMADKYIKYSLVKNGETPVTALLNTLGTNPNRVLTTGNITAGTTDTYELRLWIDSAADNNVMGTVFRGQIRVEASQVAVEPVGSTYYYAFGTPTTSSTTDYTTLGKNVFSALASDDLHEVCINDGGLFCIQTNDYDNSVEALKAYFGESSCAVNSFDFFHCTSSHFDCEAHSIGDVCCYDNSTGEYCSVDGDGSFYCD